MRPSSLGCLVVGMVVSCIFSVSVLLYSAGSGVKRVLVVLEGFSVSEFSLVQLCILLR